MIFSETEQALYDYIKTGKKTITDIQKDLSPWHMGAMGKLIKAGDVEKVKVREGTEGLTKMVTYYQIIEEEKTDDSQENNA